MIAFHRSSFLWKSHPWTSHPYYKYDGGFVGVAGQVYQVRFHLEAACTIQDGHRETTMYLGAPCRSEFTIASRNLFQVPSSEWRMAFSRDRQIPISKRPSTEEENTRSQPLEEMWQSHHIDIRYYNEEEILTEANRVTEATINQDLMNGSTTYIDPKTGLCVCIEYPVDLININEADAEFQVCTGPVLLPDLSTWDGQNIHRSFLADVAISSFDHAEFILRREVDVAEHDRSWYEQPVGLDRFELIDPNNKPDRHPPTRPKPLVYQEVWEKAATNVILKTDNI